MQASGMRVDVMKKDSFNHLRRRSSADHTDRRTSRGRSPERRSSRKDSDMESGYRRRQSSDEVMASTKPSIFSRCGLCVRVALALYALVAAVFIYSLLRQRVQASFITPERASDVSGAMAMDTTSSATVAPVTTVSSGTSEP